MLRAILECGWVVAFTAMMPVGAKATAQETERGNPLTRDEVVAWLGQIDKLPKPTLSWPLSDEMLADTELLTQWARITHGVSIRLDADESTWQSALAANPRYVGLNWSPLHKPCVKGGVFFAKGEDPTSAESTSKYQRYLDEFTSICHEANRRRQGTSVVVLFDYERGLFEKQIQGLDGPVRQSPNDKLRERLSEFTRTVWDILGEQTAVIWYRQGHWGVGGGRLTRQYRPTVPEGTLSSGYWNAELYQVSNHELMMAYIQWATEHRPQAPGSVWIALGLEYARRPWRAYGSKSWSWNIDTEYPLGDSYQMGWDLYSKSSSRLPGSKYIGLDKIDVIMLWPEPGRAPWRHVIAFILGGRQQSAKMKELLSRFGQVTAVSGP